MGDHGFSPQFKGKACILEFIIDKDPKTLEYYIRSKKTLSRPRDLAVIEILEKTLDEKKNR